MLEDKDKSSSTPDRHPLPHVAPNQALQQQRCHGLCAAHLMGFSPPAWAAQPSRLASLQVFAEGNQVETLPVDSKPYYTFGRDSLTCDVSLNDSSCSSLHAALVHHEDGRLYVIDLQSAYGTFLDKKRIAPHKPTQLTKGSNLTFGALPWKFVVECEITGVKRGRGEDRAMAHEGTVRASHLLVKHRDSRRPSSWKQANITRSPEEALDLIRGFQEQLVNGRATFAELAARESDCSSARRGGDLGTFGPGQMQAPFEDAVYALKVNELSEPVQTQSGTHLIFRTG